jgi:hypothetical protein
LLLLLQQQQNNLPPAVATGSTVQEETENCKHEEEHVPVCRIELVSFRSGTGVKVCRLEPCIAVVNSADTS